MIRAQIKLTKWGWRTDLVRGGERIKTMYSHSHETALEWACWWLKTLNSEVPC